MRRRPQPISALIAIGIASSPRGCAATGVALCDPAPFATIVTRAAPEDIVALHFLGPDMTLRP